MSQLNHLIRKNVQLHEELMRRRVCCPFIRILGVLLSMTSNTRLGIGFPGSPADLMLALDVVGRGALRV
jgi:hypothetical protein